MIESGFPEFFRRSDEEAASWQGHYLWSQKLQLGALVVAAVMGAVGGLQPLVVAAFVVALTAQSYRTWTRADWKWWDGRAAAESAKTMAWLYVVAGVPFGRENTSAKTELANRLRDIAAEISDNANPIPVSGSQVTAQMDELRSKPLRFRIDVYRKERIGDQCNWYNSKSKWNKKRSKFWTIVGVILQALAIVFGVASVALQWQVDAVGIFAAASAVVVAWIAVKQYEALARSYAVASNELAVIEARIEENTWTEDEWAEFVNSAEEAISREHTLWRASRAV